MSDEIKKILDKFNKTLENYELDKKFGQLSVDSICHLFPNEQQLLLDYITNLQQLYDKALNDLVHESHRKMELQQENERLKKLEYKFFYCSEDEESFTLEDYLELGNKVYDLEEENEYLKKQNDEKAKIGLADHKYASQMEDKVILLQQENERLKEANVYCNRTDCIGRIKDSRKYDSVYQEKNDYKSRLEKADELLELKQLRYLNEPEYRICTLDLQEVRELLQGGKDDNN